MMILLLYNYVMELKNTAPGGSDTNRKLSNKITNYWRTEKGKNLLGNVGLVVFFVFIITATFKPAFLIQSYQVDGQSMYPTLSNNDRLIVNKLPLTIAKLTNNPFLPSRGDIIIFNQSGLVYSNDGLRQSSQNDIQKQLIKRVIGLPGERVVVKDGKITVYNQAYPGGFNPDQIGIYTVASPITPGNVDYTLNRDQFFVSGDNRTNSEDSRYFGPINKDKIVAKLVLRILPINKAQAF